MVQPKQLWVEATRRANRTLTAPAIRRTAIRAYRGALSLNRLLPGPRMLLVGPAKSGTHLLSDCVSLMPRTAYSGRHLAMHDFLADGEPPWRAAFSFADPPPRIDRPRLTRFLSRCAPGMFVTAHARWSPVLREILDGLEFRTVVLLRDPRDVVVSLTKYVQREPHHFHHRWYTEVLQTPDERLMASIRGFTPDDPSVWPLPSVGENLAGYLAWQQSPNTIVVRFEDLIGARGGGDDERRLTSIEQIGAHLGRPLDRSTAAGVAERMYSRSSSTFRKGEIGDWRNHFTDVHRAAFKEVAGDLLVQMGYEDDTDW